MEITKDAIFIFEKSSLKILNDCKKQKSKKKNEVKIKYFEYPEIQNVVRRMAEKIAEDYALSAFGHVCTLCGQCCRRENIFVSGRDIFQISNHFGMTVEGFREKYLTDAGTWNSFDGFIKLEDGKCPFLVQKPSGRYFCSVYDVRPSGCRDFHAVSPLCKKDVSFLLDRLQQIDVERESARIKVALDDGIYSDGKTMDIKIGDDEILGMLRDIKGSVALIKNDSAEMAKDIMKKDLEILEKFAGNFAEELKNPKFGENFENLKNSALETIEVCVANKVEAEFCDKFYNLLNFMESEAAKFKNKSARSLSDKKNFKDIFKISLESENFPIKSVNIFPDYLTINYIKNKMALSYPVAISEDEKILKSIRNLLKAAMKIEGIAYNNAISDVDPPCYLCGECCKIYTVEVRRIDIIRIADEFNITEEECRDKYFNPVRFSWNRFAGVLKMMPISDGDDEEFCQFLKQGGDGYFYCSIHDFKPGVCRKYAANHTLCKVINNRNFWFRLPANIMRLDLMPEQIVLNIRNQDKNSPKKETIPWKKYFEISESVRDLMERIRVMPSPMPAGSKK